jgi:hypothetical protein
MPPTSNYLRFEDEETQFLLDLWLFSRNLKDVTKAVNEKKITSGLLAVVTNLTHIGLKLTAAVMSAGGTEMLGVGTALVQTGLTSGVTAAELTTEGIAIPVAEKVAGKITTSVGRPQGAASFSAFSNREEKKPVLDSISEFVLNAAKNAAMVPQLTAMFNGLKQINLDRGDWQIAKQRLIDGILTIIDALDEVIPWNEAEREVTWKGSRVPLRKKSITSKQLLAKYSERVRAFRAAVESRENRKEKSLTMPLNPGSGGIADSGDADDGL